MNRAKRIVFLATQNRENCTEDSDYEAESDASSSSDELVEAETSEECSVLQDIERGATRKKKKNVDRRKWRRNENKIKRMKGEEFLGFSRPKNRKWKHDTPRDARSMKEKCNGMHKKKKVYDCDKLTEEQRQNIFSKFWADLNWDQKKMFVVNHVKKCSPKRRQHEENEQKKTVTLVYYLEVDKKLHRVCKKTFINTLALGEWSVRNWCKEAENGMLQSQENKVQGQRPKESIKETKTAIKRNYLEMWLDSLPKLPSHYARRDSKKNYIEDNTVSCGKDKPLSIFVFCEIFDQKNMGIFQPRKDQPLFF